MSQRQSILAVTNMYPPHHYGGYELSCRDVLDRFRAMGHAVTVLTTDMRVAGVESPAGERAAGIRRDLGFYWDDHRLVSPSVPRRLALERRNQRALDRALGEAQPDVVSIWNMGAMSLGLLSTLVDRGVPLVYAVCDDWPEYAIRLDAWMRLFAHRPRVARVVRTLTGVPTSLPDLGATGAWCFVSERTRRFAEEQAPWRFARSTVVYSGIDRRDFPEVDRFEVRRGFGWRLLAVGRIDARKGLDTAIRALPLLPTAATLDIVGRGDAEELARLRNLAAELGVDERVRFDVAERHDLPARYAAADAVLFTSTWDEPFGLVPVEAMACGAPVVATGRGGSAEFLRDGTNCVLFEAGDAAALVAALCRLEAAPELRQAVVDGGLRTAADLTIDRLAESFAAWHAAAAAGFRDGCPPQRALDL